MATTSCKVALLLSRFHHHHQLPLYTHQLFFHPSPPSATVVSKNYPVSIDNCLISDVDGGRVSVTRKSVLFDHEFSVIGNMLKKIESLDTSVRKSGISDSAKDPMKQTTSTMLGLLLSNQFTVMVKVLKHPFDRLLSSSFITRGKPKIGRLGPRDVRRIRQYSEPDFNYEDDPDLF